MTSLEHILLSWPWHL